MDFITSAPYFRSKVSNAGRGVDSITPVITTFRPFRHNSFPTGIGLLPNADGVLRLARSDFLPSCPSLFLPHEKTSPDAVKTSVCLPPQTTSTISCSSGTRRASRKAYREPTSPFLPRSPPPLRRGLPASAATKLCIASRMHFKCLVFL